LTDALIIGSGVGNGGDADADHVKTETLHTYVSSLQRGGHSATPVDPPMLTATEPLTTVVDRV